MESEYFFEASHITKKFGAVVANDDISFGIRKAEIVGLVGDNGAGKTTLVKQIMGVERPTKGDFYLDGKKVEISSPTVAKSLGINAVYQELALFPSLSIVENIFAGSQLTGPLGISKWKIMKEKAYEKLRVLMKDEVPRVDTPVKELSGGQRQEVAIARALLFNVRLLILDEPTSALSVREREKIGELVTALKDQGISIIYIGHNIEEVFNLVDRFIILSRGKKIADIEKKNTSLEEVVALIVSGGAIGRSHLK